MQFLYVIPRSAVEATKEAGMSLHESDMSAMLMSTEDCPECAVAAEDINNMRAEIERLRAALHRIAFEPLGPAEASGTRVLVLVMELARETLKANHELPAGRPHSTRVQRANELDDATVRPGPAR